MPGVEQSRKRQSLNRAGIPNPKWKLAFIAFPRDHNVGCNAIEMCIEGVRRYALSSLRFERSIPHLASWPCCVLLLPVVWSAELWPANGAFNPCRRRW